MNTKLENILNKPRTKSEYWSWFAWTIFLVVPVDLLLTTFVVETRGIEGEINPIMHILFGKGVVYIILSHILVIIIASLGFVLLLETLDTSPRILSTHSPTIRPYASIVLDIWLALILSVGLAIFANNLLVLLGEPSLIEFVQNVFTLV